MGAKLMAIVCEGTRGRVYLSPTQEIEDLAREAKPTWQPELELPKNTRDFKTPLYGMNTFASLFTPRQLLALTTFSDLVGEMREESERDALAAGWVGDRVGVNDGGNGAKAYAETIATYLGFVIDKCSDYWSAICSWHVAGQKIGHMFSRQAIPMNWDYAETNIFSDSSGNWMAMVDWTWKALERTPGLLGGQAAQADAQTQTLSRHAVVSTDPPYFDNIGYADLSDFFYVWLRHNLSDIYPDLFATVAVPKAEELVATPYRHGSKGAAEAFFMKGMTEAMKRLANLSHVGLPVTIYYAYKQSETDSNSGTASTGWETFLDAVVAAGFSISGTWPMRTELMTRSVGRNSNALASSIVLVCRKRPDDAGRISRSDFLGRLRSEFPSAFAKLQEVSIAPVDLAQAAIGPGMAIYTSFSKIEAPDGTRVGVHDALSMINQVLDETLAEQEGDFEPQERLAIAWFEEYGFQAGEYGRAETLSKAKNASLTSLVEGGVIETRLGIARLLRPSELSTGWDPSKDAHLSSWEVLHQLIRALEADGETASAAIMAKVPGRYLEPARELAYRLYVVAERKGWTAEALSYNGLIQSWSEISRLSRDIADQGQTSQSRL
jgi:putative DNA methylase